MEILKQNKIYLLILLLILLWLSCVICNSTVTTGSTLLRILVNRRQLITVDDSKWKKTTPTLVNRTVPYRDTYEEQCEYLAHECLRAYHTGDVCGRTIYYTYSSFKSYCMLDYVNCRERYEVWQILHMGHCYELKNITDYIHSEYTEDEFLDQNYVIDDHVWNW